jgi:4-alpha-glucanotransferase
MVVHFYIKYGTSYGQRINVAYKQNNAVLVFELNYVDENLWHGTLNIDTTKNENIFEYKVILKKDEWQFDEELLVSGEIDIANFSVNTINVIHENFPPKNFIGLHKTKPFKKVFLPTNTEKSFLRKVKKVTHVFSIESPLLQENKYVCLTGNAVAMNNFDETNPLIFQKGNNQKSSIELDLSKEQFSIEFKIGIFDAEKKYIVEYEPGVNHFINGLDKNETISIIHLNHSFPTYAWKAAGINVPVFSLRTNAGWGVGDFTDLNLLVDYAASLGLKLIQLLPINDTTGAYTDKDSYPYSAISSFGLHPKFLNVKKMATAANVDITKDELQEINRLNALSYSDHSAVVSLKISVLKRIFKKDKNTFIKTAAWNSFFDVHNNWLVPFAAFCVLRDKFNSPDFSLWKEFAQYDKATIDAFTKKDNEHYDAMMFWYFVQFNLHLQLEDAIAYAHKNKVILKADLPIGVGRLSADTWEHTSLFVMGMQAGAPPDAFSGSGQNWSFPTYNIAEMSKDGFAWFRRRMQHLETYFDAVRIDHVLGIFRIWSIPTNQVEGTMGRFVPALPMQRNEFENMGLYIDEYRYCQPFVNEEILYEAFGNDANEVKNIFFSNGQFKNEFDDQRKIETYFLNNPENVKWQQGLFDLIANVLLFKDENAGYHFRINLFQISSYKWLSAHEKSLLDKLYHNYFFEMQNDLWRKEGEMKLEMMTDSSDMLLCAEDLGMVPDFTDEVLKNLDILSLQVQQMPKDSASQYSNTAKAKYESIVMPATHDMSPMRLWWEENRTTTQAFYNEILQEYGNAPQYCEPWVCRKIIEKHLQSPAMLSIFLMQDILALDGNIRLGNPSDERINVPANPNHVWNYRMHISLENLMTTESIKNEMKEMVSRYGR